MNILGLAEDPRGGQLWKFTATDRNGVSRNYQSRSANLTEAGMLEYLRDKFRGLKITALARITSGEFVPPDPALGGVQGDAFMSGARSGFRDDFAQMNADKQRRLIEVAMNLKPIMLDNKWGRVPDPLTNAVCDAIYSLNEKKQQNKPRSIREQYHSVRNLIRS
jgi:hypothetical protein